MRELKKVTVNVANAELYCGENGTACKHVCPTAEQIEEASAGTRQSKGWSIENNLAYDMIADRASLAWGGHGYCATTETDHVHFLVNGSVYCYEIYRDKYQCLRTR